MSRYQQLKEAAHREACEWMRCLGWNPGKSEVHRACAMNFFRKRHDQFPRFKKATKPWNARQVTTRSAEYRREAIRHLAAAEITENNALF